jgi:hypothetical protein
MNATATTSDSQTQTLQMTRGDLEDFLCGSPVLLDFADGDGSGQVLLSDDASDEFEDGEIKQLYGSGMDFWVVHPVTARPVRVLVQVR